MGKRVEKRNHRGTEEWRSEEKRDYCEERRKARGKLDMKEHALTRVGPMNK